MADHGGRGIPFEDLSVAVVTVSDTRNAATDHSGNLIEEKVRGAGCTRVKRARVSDDGERIRRVTSELLARRGLHVILVTGGTGCAPRDNTPEALKPFLEKELPGFGELFRALSFEEVGPRALLSRAFAGTVKGKALFVLPGSTKAVALALDRLILPVLPHLMELLREGSGTRDQGSE